MNAPLRIAVADDEPDMRDFFRKVLSHLGHDVVAVAEDGQALIDECRATSPDLVISDIAMPHVDGIEALHTICRERPVPAVLVSAHHQETQINRALEEYVLAYLVKPIKKADLQPAISLAMRRFKEFQALQNQTDSLRQALEDRKVIERAKGILMTKAGLTEPDAFRRLQKLSSDKNLKLAEISRIIVTADEAMSRDP